MRRFKEFIEGTLIPISWEKSGEVKLISVYTQDGEDIILNHHYKPRLINSLLNKKVKVFGESLGEKNECKLFFAKRILKKAKPRFNWDEHQYQVA